MKIYVVNLNEKTYLTASFSCAVAFLNNCQKDNYKAKVEVHEVKTQGRNFHTWSVHEEDIKSFKENEDRPF